MMKTILTLKSLNKPLNTCSLFAYFKVKGAIMVLINRFRLGRVKPQRNQDEILFKLTRSITNCSD